jgi:hypothetical protein
MGVAGLVVAGMQAVVMLLPAVLRGGFDVFY